jgi:hypothetical protein
MAKHNLPHSKARRSPKRSAKRSEHRGSNTNAGREELANDGDGNQARGTERKTLAVQSLKNPDYPIGREPNTLYELWKCGAFPQAYHRFAVNCPEIGKQFRR